MLRDVIFVFLGAFLTLAADPPSIRARAGEFTEEIACAADPGQTYTLYLPLGFTKDRRAPVLLIFDPRGRSRFAAELFRAAADAHGWILVSSDNTRSDESWRPNMEALEALWPELDRLPVDRRRVYAAGFSGTVAVATLLATMTGEVTGVLACARARLGRERAAVEALQQAFERGFSNPELLQTDQDLDSLRDREDFQALINAHSPP